MMLFISYGIKEQKKTRRMHMARLSISISNTISISFSISISFNSSISISISIDYPRVQFFSHAHLGSRHPSGENMYCEMWAKAYTVLQRK